jgi:hypothetical protein
MRHGNKENSLWGESNAVHLQIVVNNKKNAWRPLKYQQKIGKTAKITSENKREASRKQAGKKWGAPLS